MSSSAPSRVGVVAGGEGEGEDGWKFVMTICSVGGCGSAEHERLGALHLAGWRRLLSLGEVRFVQGKKDRL